MTTLIFNIIPMFLGNIKPWEIIIIALVILLLFGGRKITEMMRGIGKGIHSFKQGFEEAKAEINKPVEKVDIEPAKAKDRDE